jgi:benzoyl-CoA reductase/2-hydroxyglutaryl-CoA dehydratase subunit BcrC/BadD/HgdB
VVGQGGTDLIMGRLRTTFDVFAWYDRVRAMGRPVAWCSAFAPAEVLVALGVVPVYPENHAAILGALSETRDPDQPYARAAIAAAEAAGYATPKLCAYALADLGVLAGGQTSPIGGLPAPDLFYACDSQCAVVARWGDQVQQVVQRQEGRHVPHYVLRAPPVRGAGHTPEQVAGFTADLAAHAAEIAARFGTVLDPARLAAVVAESAAANRLWQECLALGRHRPAPWTNLDAFTAMAPIVIARGFPEATDFYRRLLAELQERVAAGHAAVPGERLRLVWDAIPVWPRKNWFARFFAERGVAVVASTYTHSWWFSFDPDRPLASLAERYAWNTMNLPAATVLDWTLAMVRDYQADGIVAHWNRSCGIWNSYVKRRMPGYAAAGVPACQIDADMVDARAFDESAVSARLDAFLSRLPQH